MAQFLRRLFQSRQQAFERVHNRLTTDCLPIAVKVLVFSFWFLA